jgi:hypothetical protein
MRSARRDRPKHSGLPLRNGERVGVRAQLTFDSPLPPHPDRFAIRPLPAGERWRGEAIA